MASVECQFHGCRRRVDENSPWGYYCFDHRQYSPLFAAVQQSPYEALPSWQTYPPSSIPDSRASLKELLLNSGLSLDEATVDVVSQSVSEWKESAPDDMDVPSVSSSHSSGENRRLHEILSRSMPNRASLLRVRGLNRMVLRTGKVQKAEDYEHEVIILDRNTEKACIIDVSMPSLAPVWDSDAPVDSQMESGVTPFGDVPWIGSQNDYVNGSYLWWDNYYIA